MIAAAGIPSHRSDDVCTGARTDTLAGYNRWQKRFFFSPTRARTLSRELKIPERRISLHCRALPRIRHNPISRRGADHYSTVMDFARRRAWSEKEKKKKGMLNHGVHVKLARLRKR